MNDEKAKVILESIEYAIKTGILTDDDLDEMLDMQRGNTTKPR